MILVRHAQSEWNVHFGLTRVDPDIPDPAITELGQEQAHAIADKLKGHGITRLLASPYRRSVQTAVIIAQRLGGLPVTIEPLIRERRAFSCDQGSQPEELRAQFPGLAFDHLPRNWWGQAIESQPSLAERVRRFRASVHEMSGADSIAAVSHWGFIRAATGEEVDNVGLVPFR